MAKIIRPVKGTRDFYPAEMARRNWLYTHMRAAAEAFGYQEWEAPILETLELYAAKSGEELVKEQAFVFEDRGGSEITLRPELTPSLARLIAQRANEIPRPIRWWSFGPFWRYERPQKGRSREFFQWNVDILGSNAVTADAEIGAVAATLFQNIGLTSEQVCIQVNSRRLMESKLGDIGIGGGQMHSALQLIDRLDKLSPDKWRDYGLNIGLDGEQVGRLRALLDNRELWRESDELVAFFEVLEAYSLRDWFEYQPRVVRGLDYYTGIVMEGRDRDSEFRSIFGGGRYDNLVAAVGSKEPVPATGFAMGDVVMGLVVDKYNLTPSFGGSTAQILVTIFDDERLIASLRFAGQLRQQGWRVELYPEAHKMRKQLKYANAQNVPLAAIIGPDETAVGQVTLKALDSGKQYSVPQAEAGELIGKLLAGGRAS